MAAVDAMEVMSACGNKTGGLPFTVLVDPSGSIVARHPGVLEEAAATALRDGLLVVRDGNYRTSGPKLC
jgi:alkyl hydroperoxide reductase subunit AhpC